MNKFTIAFIAGLAVMIGFAMFASYSGAMLPGPSDEDAVSLRDVQTRRTHFFHYYAMGK